MYLISGYSLHAFIPKIDRLICLYVVIVVLLNTHFILKYVIKLAEQGLENFVNVKKEPCNIID